ncbi:MAG: MipA/OmpV family protein [Sphingomonadales bacterium]|nr:MAG: MipA/OmpV family protein [Sphingomonadales bacterium]
MRPGQSLSLNEMQIWNVSGREALQWGTEIDVAWTRSALLVALASACVAAPLNAQDEVARPRGENGPPPGVAGDENVFDGDWLRVGIGLGVSSSYDGSDDYRLVPFPFVQGRIAGIGISPRGPGLAFDITPVADQGADLSFGPVVRLRSDRASGIRDDVVRQAGKLDRAVEIGLNTGFALSGVSKRGDRLSFGLEARHDVASAHNGFVVAPSVSYSRPFGRAVFAQLSANIEWVSDDYADYYYSVSPAQSAASGLSEFAADGGLTSIGTGLLVGFDLDGNALNGGLGLVTITGYSRLVGDAKDTPYTSVRGSADQFFGAVGVVYTF